MNNQKNSKENFFKISVSDQKEILQVMANKLGKTDQILEKDIWICLTLEKLFSMPKPLNMVFKGGTSLSKAFNLIQRFSEDLDITLDYKNFTDKDPVSSNLSRTKCDKLSDFLKESMKDYIKTVILPYLEMEIQNESNAPISIILGSNRDTLEINYQSVCDSTVKYIKSSVFLEFGARNAIEPNKIHKIIPYIATEIPTLNFPVATPNVLIAERTFWEKVTLIHVECNRGEFKKNADRLSRHWYDLVMLFQSPLGKSAIQDKSLLEDVVKHKKVFFNTSYANYDECLLGNCNLIPNHKQTAKLKADYEEMISSNMFYGEPLSFKEILNQIERLKSELAGR